MRVTLYGFAAILAGANSLAAGCSVSVGVNEPTVLVSVTGRSMPGGQALAFLFTPEAGGLVSISVQASTDAANPDFYVVRGEVDFVDLDSIPLGDVFVLGIGDDAGQEIGSFTPDVSETYTLFVTDPSEIDRATFSVSVTQE